VRFAVSCIFQDSGEATRAIEICSALSRAKPGLDIVFISRGSAFEPRVREKGWKVFDALPRMSGVGLHQDMKMRDGEIIGDPEIAEALLRGETEAYRELRPDIVLYGFWPVAGVARRMADPVIPGICFIPLPISERFIRDIDYVPESAGILGAAPRALQRALLSLLPYAVKARNPGFAHSILDRAARKVYGSRYGSGNIVDMLAPDLMLVNDIAEHYGRGYPAGIEFTGPLYSAGGMDDAIDERIERILAKRGKKVFCTLGSSGTRAEIEEIAEALASLPEDEYAAVLLCPPSVADAELVGSSHRLGDNIALISSFVPAKRIMERCDIVVSHGGQGTVQTAIAAGLPLVGVPMQAEQDMNLERVSGFGAGVKIPRRRWKAHAIAEAVRAMANDSRYSGRAKDLRRIHERYGGADACAASILRFMGRLSGV